MCSDSVVLLRTVDAEAGVPAASNAAQLQTYQAELMLASAPYARYWQRPHALDKAIQGDVVQVRVAVAIVRLIQP